MRFTTRRSLAVCVTLATFATLSLLMAGGGVAGAAHSNSDSLVSAQPPKLLKSIDLKAIQLHLDPPSSSVTSASLTNASVLDLVDGYIGSGKAHSDPEIFLAEATTTLDGAHRTLVIATTTGPAAFDLDQDGMVTGPLGDRVKPSQAALDAGSTYLVGIDASTGKVFTFSTFPGSVSVVTG